MFRSDAAPGPCGRPRGPGVGLGRGGRDQFFENEAIRGEFSARNGKRYGIRGEFSARNGKRYGIRGKFSVRKAKRYDTRYIIFQPKTRKTRKKLEKPGGKMLKTGKNRK